LAFAVVLPSAFGQINVLTNKMDNARTGQNTAETLLTISNVTPNRFGKQFATSVDGYIQAQPLYMSALTVNGATRNVVFVATLHNSVYAIDADTGAQLWQVNFGASVPSATEGCSGVTGFNEIGILSTPVIDAVTKTMYVTAKTYAGGVAAYSLHAIDVTTGQEKFGGPVTISATVGTLSFTPLQHIQRPGLVLSHNTLYIAFGSNGCDLNARGWLYAYSPSSLQQLGTMITQPDNSFGSSIWQAGVAPAADEAGNIYFSTANGTFNFSAFDLGDSIVKLSFGFGGFTLADSFTPFDQDNMATNDLDLGSGGVTLLPTQGRSNTPHLLVTSGKDKDIYLINRDNLGGYNPIDNSQIPLYLPAALQGFFFGNPVYWNNNVYFLAHQDYLRSYTLGVDGTGKSILTAGAQTTDKLTTTGLPVISSTGTSNGILWVVRTVKSVPLFSAYDAKRLLLLYDSGMVANGRDTLGTIGHFATPTVANGHVYAGTQTQLVTYGLFSQVNPTGGNNQTGYAGTTLPVPLTVKVTNPYTGSPLAGVAINFSDGGKGTITNPDTFTDSNGQASTTYTLPTLPQTITIVASSVGLAPATFTEQDTVGPVATLTVVSGGKQTGTVGTTLPLPLVFKAKDAVGNVVPGASVTFNDGNNGLFTPNPAITASNGQATTSYTLPTVAKSLLATATAGSVSVNASEKSVPDVPISVIKIQGDNQTAHKNNKLPKMLIVAVVDKYGNGISGLTVDFDDNSAGGTLTPQHPVTNSIGQASTGYTTGSQLGTVTIDATYGTLPPAVFTETVN